MGIKGLLVGVSRAARRALAASIGAAAAATWLIGCSSIAPQGGVVGPEGGVVFGADGSAVGIAAGLLTAALSVEVGPGADPGVPLPADVTQHGSFVAVRTSAEVHFSGTWGGFIVGVPVPEGVPVDALGLAVFVPAGADEHGASPHWAVRHGVFYAPRRLLLAALPSLSPQGSVVQLVSGAFLVSPEAEQPAPARVATRQTGSVPPWPTAFQVVEREPRPAAGTNAATFFQTALDGALVAYRDAGFRPFALETTGGDLWLEPPSFAVDPADLRYVAYTRAYFSDTVGVDPDTRCELSQNVVATYAHRDHELMLCAPVDPAAYTDAAQSDGLRRNAYHELFHAVQKAYFVEHHANTGIKYFKEGTASLAEMFLYGSEVRRSPDFGPRAVEPALTDITGTRHYRVQDFWYRVAERHGLTFPQLTRPFLEAGDAVPAVVDAVLRADPFGSSLAEEYRLWVQHQVYDLSACSLRDGDGDGQPDTVLNVVDLGTVMVEEGIAPSFPSPHAVNLPALSATVVQFAVLNNRSQPYAFRVRVTDDLALDVDPASSRVAVVEDAFVTCSITPGAAFEPALAGAGGSVREVEIPSGSSIVLYAIVANDRLEVPVQGSIAFEPLPPFQWPFDRTLEGWQVGVAGGPDGWGTVEWRDFCGTGRPVGCVKLDGLGGPGVANAWIYRTIELPPDVTTLRFETSAHNRDGADSEYRVRLIDASANAHVLVPWTTTSGAEGAYLWQSVQVGIGAFAGTTVTIYLEGGDNSPGEHEQRYFDNVAID